MSMFIQIEITGKDGKDWLLSLNVQAITYFVAHEKEDKTHLVVGAHTLEVNLPYPDFRDMANSVFPTVMGDVIKKVVE